MVHDSWFRVQGSGCRVQGDEGFRASISTPHGSCSSALKAECAECSGFKAWFKAQGQRVRVRVEGL